MRRLQILAFAAAALPLASAPAAAAKDKPPITLAKTTKWVVDYDDDSCHLVTAFGADKQRVVVRFTKFQPGDEFQLVLYGKPVAANGTSTKLRLDFGGSSPGEPVTALVGTRQSDPLLLVTSTNLRADRHDDEAALTPAEEGAVSQLNFQVERKQPYRLDLGSMGPPMAAMRTCLSDLIKHWGYDPQASAALMAKPQPISNPATWLTSNDYPSAALMNGHNGVVHFRLDVDETGKVLKCAVIGKTSPSDFEKATCSGVSRRARFKPALDPAGKPARAFHINTVRWTMP